MGFVFANKLVYDFTKKLFLLFLLVLGSIITNANVPIC